MAIFPGSAIPSAADAAYEIDNSLRFNKADDPRLTRTPGSSGNRKTWTFSCWYKNTVVDSYQKILSAGANADTTNNYTTRLYIDSDPTNYLFRFKQDITAGNADLSFLLTRVIRDPGAWYHFCVAVDTTQATEANRVKIYINGVLLTASDYTTASYPDQDDDTYVNHTNLHMIGHGEDSIDGYLAEVYLIDGTQLAASDFGETDSTTNQWIPLDSDDVKDAVTFGTNGFYQKYNSTELATSFTDSSSAFVPTEPLTVDYLVIAGGGGGNAQGGGGGAGGYRCSVVGENTGGGGSAEAALSVSAQSYPITVGAGGAQNTNGSNSVFSTITAIGGGTGGDEGDGPTVGGSGGGGGRLSQAGAAAASPTQGYAGGDAGPSPESGNIAANYSAGGGGGAGAVGEDNQGASGPGDGGDGLSSSIDGSATFRGGGGGGGKHTSGGSNSAGGNGGGGIGYVYTTTAGTAGTANTGGGGGGGAGQYGVVTGTGGAGGSGVVIIRYISTTAKATGGTITSYVDSGNTYQVHTFTSGIHTITATNDVKNVRGANLDTTYAQVDAFTSTGSDTWTCPTGVTSIELLVVAGGAGGGGGRAGGGGAGGVIHDTSYTVVPGVVYDLSVGAGGAAGGSWGTNGTDGSDSVWNVNAEGSGITITADGGGKGAGGAGNAFSGGSGGGGTYSTSAGGSATQTSPTGATGYGNVGGASSESGSYSGGGGGGAGAVGGSSQSSGVSGKGGAGGDGKEFTTFSSYGVSGFFAGGGGGGAYPDSASSTGGAGGSGGGGTGARDYGGSITATAGTANTGSGGGGGAENSTAGGGAGGSGVILIAYNLTKPGSSSIEFDGVNDYLQISDGLTDFDFGTDDACIEFWINTTQTDSPDVSRVITRGTNPTEWFFRSYTKATEFVKTNIGGSIVSFDGSSGDEYVSDGAWHHVALQRTSTALRCYIDGIQRFSNTSISGSWAVTSITNTIGIGQGIDAGTGEDFDGYLDEIRISVGVDRYPDGTTFTVPRTQFTADANTKLLIHSDWTGGLGADSSGNFNAFTPTNLDATDQMIDTPTNNFATMSPVDASWVYSTGQTVGPPTFSEGNLKLSHTTGSDGYEQARGTIAVQSGKWYFEALLKTSTDTYQAVGIATTSTEALRHWGGQNAAQWVYQNNGNTINGSGGESGFNTYAAGDIISVAFDCDAGKLWWAKNGTWEGSGVPASGTNARYTNLATQIASDGNPVAAFNVLFDATSVWIYNFGSDSSFVAEKTAQGNQDGNSKGDFYYEPPSGFLALCTDNLSTPEVKLPGDYFGTVAYAGDESNPTSAGAERTLDVGFQPDFSWLKIRTEEASNRLFDSTRGSNKALYSNSDAQEAAGTSGYIDRWVATGPVVKAESDGDNRDVNVTGEDYVIWNWKAGGAPTADNSAGAGATPTAGSVKIDGSNLGSALAGSIAATRLSANTESGFSIVQWVGDGGSSSTIATGLSQQAELIINKNYSDSGGVSWVVYSSAIMPTTSNTDRLVLNSTAAEAADATIGAVTATTWQPSNGTGSVNGTGASYVTYCFHSVEGYSKVGSFTGADSTDANFLYCGFRPAMVIMKNAGATEQWVMYDNKRNAYNVVDDRLRPDSNAVEAVHGALDFVSNGIKIRSADISSPQEYVYIAFAESPFKYANAR